MLKVPCLVFHLDSLNDDQIVIPKEIDELNLSERHKKLLSNTEIVKVPGIFEKIENDTMEAAVLYHYTKDMSSVSGNARVYREQMWNSVFRNAQNKTIKQPLWFTENKPQYDRAKIALDSFFVSSDDISKITSLLKNCPKKTLNQFFPLLIKNEKENYHPENYLIVFLTICEVLSIKLEYVKGSKTYKFSKSGNIYKVASVFSGKNIHVHSLREGKIIGISKVKLVAEKAIGTITKEMTIENCANDEVDRKNYITNNSAESSRSGTEIASVTPNQKGKNNNNIINNSQPLSEIFNNLPQISQIAVAMRDIFTASSNEMKNEIIQRMIILNSNVSNYEHIPAEMRSTFNLNLNV